MREDVLKGRTKRIQTGCGWMYITLNGGGTGVVEVFARLGKAGGCALSQTEALGRVISLALRYGVPIEELREQLQGIRCNAPKGEVLSCADAVAKGLSPNLKEDEDVEA